VHVLVLEHYLVTYFVVGGALCYWAITPRHNKIGLGTCYHVYSQCTQCFSSAALDNIFTSSVLFQYSQL